MDSRLGVRTDVARVSDSAKKIFHARSHISKAPWGLNGQTLHLMYKTVAEAIMSYCAPTWFPIANFKLAATLLRAKQKMSLRISRAYRTVEMESTWVLAGVLSIDIILSERIEHIKAHKQSPDHSVLTGQKQKIRHLSVNKEHK